MFAGGCPLPLSGGDWYTSTRGTWTVSADGNTINNFKDDLSIAKISTLTCVSAGSTSTQYIVQ